MRDYQPIPSHVYALFSAQTPFTEKLNYTAPDTPSKNPRFMSAGGCIFGAGRVSFALHTFMIIDLPTPPDKDESISSIQNQMDILTKKMEKLKKRMEAKKKKAEGDFDLFSKV